MSEGRDLPEFDSSIEAIYRNASAQTQIIKDILDVSSIVTGKVNLEKTDVSLGEIIAGSLHSIDLAASAKSIKVTASLPDAPIFSFADPVRIQQVFWNLLTNAVKFTPANGTIHLSLEKAGAFAQIKVKDSGRGIDTDFLPYVFDRFRQEDSTLTRSYGGLGLGLSIVKSITDAHGGDVSVYSDGKGKGTEFTVSIPISPRSESLVSNGVSDEQKEIPKDTLSGVRILAIDDESDNRTIVKRFLERAGADVTLASSAQAALKILEASNFDFILSDISMPEMDGFAFIEALRSLESNRGLKPTPAGALTAYARDEEKERALQAGFQIHVAKPISQRTLISSVRVGLQMKSEEASR